MGRARSWGVLSLLAAFFAGCAAITGLGDLQEDPTLADDAGSDATTGDARPDAPPARDAAPDGFDAGVDAPPAPPDADASAIDDGASDAPADVGVDAPVDCGPKDTVANCTGCGLACDTAHSLDASCNGVTCTYSACAPGRLNCNAAAPDTNGCECATPFCCATACADQHSNGVGGFFYDCVARGTYNAPQATEACTSFTMDGTQCQTTLACDDAGTALAVCDTATKANCICWGYSGAGVGGHVAQSGPNPDGGLAVCRCPTSASPTWN